jgi:hypothetical protein
MCIVADRAHLPQLRQACRDLGGGWKAGALTLSRLDHFEYVVLCAHERRRVECRAPLMLLALDDAALHLAITHVCAQLDDTTCAWLFLVGASGRAIVYPVILADACVQGAA